MTRSTDHDLSGRRVLVPGGTGAVGEGIVRRYLAAGADVVVPTRTPPRAEEFQRMLGAYTLVVGASASTPIPGSGLAAWSRLPC